MKQLILSVAGLGYRELERRKKTRLAGLEFAAAESVFPAVTCTAQATLRTGQAPREHGMVCNGYYSHALCKPAFWEQSSKLVLGPRVWEQARAEGATVGMFFFQQSLGENVDFVLSPAPIHKHGGGMVMACYAKPASLGELEQRRNGTFPLWQYWGPLASPRVGDRVVSHFELVAERFDPELAFLYLPTLDYDAQRYGPDDPRCERAFKRFEKELERLADLAQEKGAQLTVLGEYGISAVTRAPVFPNRTLRRAGLFQTREVAGRAYPDFYESKAFAMVDHEIAQVYVRDPNDIEFVRETLEATGDYETLEERTSDKAWAHPSAGDLLLVAKAGSWCAYPWWTERREAPDYAVHIDIHNKPGYDPAELFFDRRLPFPPDTCQDPSRIRGTHGRRCEIAVAGLPKPVAGAIEAARCVVR